MTQTLPLEPVLGQGDWHPEAVSILLNTQALGLVGQAGTLGGGEGVLKEGCWKFQRCGWGWPCPGEKPQREPPLYPLLGCWWGPFCILLQESVWLLNLCLTCSHFLRLRFSLFLSFFHVGWRLQRENCFDHFCFLNLTVFFSFKLFEITYFSILSVSVLIPFFSRQTIHLSYSIWGYFPES